MDKAVAAFADLKKDPTITIVFGEVLFFNKILGNVI